MEVADEDRDLPQIGIVEHILGIIMAASPAAWQVMMICIGRSSVGWVVCIFKDGSTMGTQREMCFKLNFLHETDAMEHVFSSGLC